MAFLHSIVSMSSDDLATLMTLWGYISHSMHNKRKVGTAYRSNSNFTGSFFDRKNEDSKYSYDLNTIIG